MLSKKTFVNALSKIKEQDERVHKFSKALYDMCDGYPVFDDNNHYLEALLDVLRQSMNDKGDYISWWLWEDVEKKVWNDDKVWILDTPEKLYDFLAANVE